MLSIYHNGWKRVERIWLSGMYLDDPYVIQLIIDAKPQAAPFFARGSFQYMTYKEAEGNI
jgi:hypothetical protein